MRDITIKNLSVQYGTPPVIKDLSVTIEGGTLTCIHGASGSGKTTLLRTIAGFEKPTRGEISIDGQNILSLPPEKRSIGFVFQSYALWPHRTVKEHLLFPLVQRKVDPSTQEKRVEDTLAQLELSSLAARYPHELSGGQQQRVALARALVAEPPVILLDEPLSNLDPTLRRSIRSEIKELLRERKITALYVSHDPQESMAIADKVLILEKGAISQFDTPHLLYTKPASLFAARFFGELSLIPASLLAPHESKRSRYIRPHQVVLDTSSASPLTVTNIVFAGDHDEVTAETSSKESFYFWTTPGTLTSGAAISVILPSDCIIEL